MHGLFPRDPEHQCRRPHRQGRISSTRCSRATPRRSISVAARCCDKIADDRRPARRQHRPLHHESADDDRDRPREGGGLRHHGRQVRQELYNAFGTRQVATIYTPTNDYQVILETQPEFQADTSGAVEDLSQDQPRQHRQRRGRRAAACSAPARRTACRSRSAPSPGSSRRSGRCRSTTRASSRR